MSLAFTGAEQSTKNGGGGAYCKPIYYISLKMYNLNLVGLLAGLSIIVPEFSVLKNSIMLTIMPTVKQ